MFARATRFAASRPSVRFASTSTSTGSAFGATRKDAALWFAKATVVCGVLGYTLSETVLTDERLSEMSKAVNSKAKEFGIELPTLFPAAHAFNMIENGMHPSHMPWEHHSVFKTYDHAAIRRGYQVYRDVCAACHSMSLISWRNLVGVSHTEDEVKAMAAEYEYEDGPNDEGEMFMRPGKPADRLPAAYPNDEAARKANGGALPPDLSCIARARHGEEDYIFSLLLGYSDPPAGITLRDGLHFNRYFPGGAISMARSIYDEVVDYEDGTPNNASQLAKDVSIFLAWASYPEHDERKLMGLKAIAMSTLMLGLSILWKRYKWSHIKSKRIAYKPPSNLREV